MFKVCGFFHFSGTERVKQNFEDEDEDHSKPSILVSQIPFQVISIKAECLFSFSPVPRWVGGSTDLPSSRNISKTVRVNIASTGTFSI